MELTIGSRTDVGPRKTDVDAWLQSIQATARVRDILEDIGGAIRGAVAITERGSQKMESGLSQMRTSGESLRELSRIVKENSMSARQIAAAVSQQNTGPTVHR